MREREQKSKSKTFRQSRRNKREIAEVMVRNVVQRTKLKKNLILKMIKNTKTNNRNSKKKKRINTEKV